MENFSANLSFKNKLYNLQIIDVCGSDNYREMRTMAYPDAHLFIICFSVVSPVSFQNVLTKWIPEVIMHNPYSKILLLGTQNDLRDNEKVLEELQKSGKQPISVEKGVHLAKKIKSEGYMECSSMDCSTLYPVFEFVAKCFSQDNSKNCVLKSFKS